MLQNTTRLATNSSVFQNQFFGRTFHPSTTGTPIGFCLRSKHFNFAGTRPVTATMASSSTTTTPVQKRGFKALVVSLEGEKPKLKAVHKISEYQSFDELPYQKTLQKFDGKLATVQVDYSTMNYKDGLVLQGKPGVAKSFPIVPSMDFVGSIVEDATGKYKSSEKVILTGNYMGQHLNGFYSQTAQVPTDWLLPMPDRISAIHAMQIGTAGFTAMQSIDTLEKIGNLKNKDDAEILVLGASGGVGSFAVSILNHLGYKNITASTGQVDEHREMLEKLGATKVIPRLEKPKPLDREEYDAVIDPVGGFVTANALPRVKYGGAVALSGVAAGPSMEGATVFPFILRGVNLLGIDSVQMPHSRRQEIWNRLSDDFPTKYFDVMPSQVIGLDGLYDASSKILKGDITGRIVVDVSKEGTTSTSSNL